MGTGFKGGSINYRNIGQNVVTTAGTYTYLNGRFGKNSPSTGNKTRNISSSDPIGTAKDFYDKISYGGIEKTYATNRKVTQMSDGTIITYRETSSSDGTPVVEINIHKSNDAGGVKNQKIHFTKE